jgi:hypothetical protein
LCPSWVGRSGVDVDNWLLRTFFPKETEQASDGTISPGRLEALLHKIILFFERTSVRLYEASVAAERARKLKMTPRTLIRPPRGDEVTTHRRRLRRRLVNRVLPPVAAFATVGLIVWISNSYGPQILERIKDEFTARQDEHPAPAPDAPKDDIAAEAEKGAAALPKPDITLFNGEDAKAFVANENNPIQFVGDDKDRHVRISSSAKQSADARLIVPPEIADRLAGKTVHRRHGAPIDEDGAAVFRVSGWR